MMNVGSTEVYSQHITDCCGDCLHRTDASLRRDEFVADTRFQSDPREVITASLAQQQVMVRLIPISQKRETLSTYRS